MTLLYGLLIFLWLQRRSKVCVIFAQGPGRLGGQMSGVKVREGNFHW